MIDYISCLLRVVPEVFNFRVAHNFENKHSLQQSAGALNTRLRSLVEFGRGSSDVTRPQRKLAVADDTGWVIYQFN